MKEHIFYLAIACRGRTLVRLGRLLPAVPEAELGMGLKEWLKVGLACHEKIKFPNAQLLELVPELPKQSLRMMWSRMSGKGSCKGKNANGRNRKIEELLKQEGAALPLWHMKSTPHES